MQIFRTLCFIFFFLFLSGSLIIAAPLEQGEILTEQMESLDLKALEEQMEKLTREAGQVFPARSLGEVVQGILQGEIPFQGRVLLESLLETFFHEVLANMRFLGQMLVLAVICAILQIMQAAFGREGVAQLTRLVIYMVLVIMIIGSLRMTMSLSREAIGSMTTFMNALIPPLLTMLMGVGAVTSAAIFRPLVFMTVTLMGNLVENLIIPLIFFAGILTMVNGLQGELKVNRLVGLIKELSVGFLGLILVIFIGSMAIQGTAAAVGDGLTLRTAKYLTGAFVPVVGSMFADAVELIAGCSLVIKNAIGLVGLGGIIIVSAYPVIKILSLVFIYKLVSALIQPLGDEVLADTLNSVGNIVIMLFLALTSVSIMFFICLTVIVGMANMAVMLR